MAANGCGDSQAVGGMAVELFQLASLLVGEQGEALRLIENSLASLEIDPCLNPDQARAQARRVVVHAALQHLASEEPSAFSPAPQSVAAHDPCIQDDDLSAAGVTQDQLRLWLHDGERPELRSGLRGWIEGLPVVQRAIFVQRAVLGQGNEAAASLLREAGGEPAREWTSANVSQTFRRALCSLANSLVHASERMAAQPA